LREEKGEGMIIKSQNKDLVVDTNGNEFRMFCGSDGRYAIETRAGVLGVYKTKKKQKRSLMKSLSRLDVVKRMRSSMRGEGSVDSV
jgi:hypothetical protein